MSGTYSSTSVPVERSQGDIRKLLIQHGVAELAFGEDRDANGRRRAAVSFKHGAFAVRMRVPLKELNKFDVTEKWQRSRSGKTRDEIESVMYEQEERRIWRVLAWGLKARLVAVEEEVETFEQAFLPHLLNPETGRTIYEDLAELGEVRLPDALPQLEAPRDAEVIS